MFCEKIEFIDKLPSPLALGTANFGAGIPEGEAFAILDAWAEMGGRVLDTARVYGDFARHIPGISEALLGRWLKASGMAGEMIISTKGAHPEMGHMEKPRVNAGCINDDIDESLAALGVDTIDLYFLHRDDERVPVSEIMTALNGHVARGEITALGASNWRAARIIEANAFARENNMRGFCVTQPQFSLARFSARRDKTLVEMDANTYKLCLETGILCMPFSAQAQGFYPKLLSLGESAVRGGEFYGPDNVSRGERVRAVMERTGLSANSVSVAYLTSQPITVMPIVGASSVARVKSMRESFTAKISAEDISYLEGENRFNM